MSNITPSQHRVEANERDTVEIVWTLASGLLYVQQVTIPPPASREARRNAAGQVIDRPFINAAGQKFNLQPQPPEPYTTLDVVGTSGGKATTEVFVPHAAPSHRGPVRPPEGRETDRPDE
jgi:hypothetical protein